MLCRPFNVIGTSCQQRKMSVYLLPNEIFGPLIAHIARYDPESLANFALINKSCLAWCLPVLNSLLFHDIRMNIRKHTPAKPFLSNFVNRLVQKIEKVDSLQHVRRLVVDEHTCSLCEEDDHQWHPPRIEDLKCGDVPGQPYRPLYGNLNHPHFRRPLPDWTNCGERDVRRPLVDVHLNNGSWRPLITLLDKLPKLEDLVWLCNEQFPPCLLGFLHQSRPKCRLRLYSFFLQSLGVMPMFCRYEGLDPYELKLATSPSLYSVVLHTKETNGWNYNDPCYQQPALKRLLRLAPSLEEVYIGRAHACGPSPRGSHPLRFPEFAKEEYRSDPLPGWLKRLQIYDCNSILRATLIEWSHCTDFAVLQSLELEADIDCQAMGFLSNCSFPSLHKLSMWLKAPRQPKMFYELAGDFLRTLPPLTELHLEGFRAVLPVKSIVEHHGRRLRKLAVLYEHRHHQRCLTQSDIKHIATFCPLLEDLACKVQRSQGDASELALYQTLASIRRLKYLSSYLCLSDPRLLWRGRDGNWDESSG